MTISLATALSYAFVPESRPNWDYKIRPREICDVQAPITSGSDVPPFAVGWREIETSYTEENTICSRIEQCELSVCGRRGSDGHLTLVIALDGAIRVYTSSETSPVDLTLQCILKMPETITQISFLANGLLACLTDHQLLSIVNVTMGSVVASIDLELRFDRLWVSGNNIVVHGDCSYIACVTYEEFRLVKSHVLYLDYWPAGFLKLGTYYYYVVHPNGTYNVYWLHNGQLKPKTGSQLVTILGNRLIDPSFGRLVSIEEIGHGRWIALQETGWTLYEVSRHGTRLNEVVTSPLTSKFEHFVVLSSSAKKDYRFAVHTSNGDIMLVCNGIVRLVPAGDSPPVSITVLGSELYGVFLSRTGTSARVEVASLVQNKQTAMTWSGKRIEVVTFDPYCSSFFVGRVPYDDFQLRLEGNKELVARNGSQSGVLGRVEGKLAKLMEISGIVANRDENRYFLVLGTYDMICICVSPKMKLIRRVTLTLPEPIKFVNLIEDEGQILEAGDGTSSKWMSLAEMAQTKMHSVASEARLSVLDNVDSPALDDCPETLNNFLLRSPVTVAPLSYTLYEGSPTDKSRRHYQITQLKRELKSGWLTVLAGKQAVARNMAARQGQFSADLMVVESTLGSSALASLCSTNLAPDSFDYRYLLYRFCEIMGTYDSKASAAALDAAETFIATVSAKSTEFALVIFDNWYSKLQGEGQDFVYGTILITLCIVTNDHPNSTSEIDYFSADIAENVLASLLKLLECPEDRDVALGYGLLTKLEFRILRHPHLLDPVRFFRGVFDMRARARRVRRAEVFDACNSYIEALFVKDPSFVVVLLSSLLVMEETLQVCKGSILESLGALMSTHPQLVTASHIMLVSDSCMSVVVRDESLLKPIEALDRVLASNFGETLCVSRNLPSSRQAYFCVMLKEGGSLGYSGSVIRRDYRLAKLSSIYLKSPKIEDEDEEGSTAGVIRPVFSANQRQVAAIDVDAEGIVIWNLNNNFKSQSQESVDVKVFRNGNVPLKVPDFGMLFIQSFWSSEKYSSRFLRVNLMDVVAQYGGQEGRSFSTASVRDFIPIGDVLSKYLMVFEDLQYSDLEVEWVSEDKIGLKLKGRIIYAYQV